MTRPAHLKQCLCSCGWVGGRVGAIKSVRQVLKGTLTHEMHEKTVSACQYCPVVRLEMTVSKCEVNKARKSFF